MAVQAQHPSNIPLLNRSVQERREMDFSQQPPGLLDQPPLFFANNGVNGNQRKRGRESSAAAAFQMVPTPQINLLSPSIHSPALITLAQLHTQSPPPPPPPLVSTGLRLSFEDNNNQTQNQSQYQTQLQSQSNPFIQQDLASLINHQKDDIEQYLIAQREQLRRALVEKRQKHYPALLAAAEESASRRLTEKDLELDRAVRKNAELEDRIARLRTESLTWQAKAMSGQAAAASLHAQIQQAQLATAAAEAAAANKRTDECCGESSAAEDAESAHVDPNRVEDWRRACWVSVVMLPCRHLCLCSAGDAAVADSDAACCPVCHAVRTGSIQVFLS